MDILHGCIITYPVRISQNTLSEEQTHDFINLMATAIDLENIGDVIETDLVHQGYEGIEQGVSISDATKKILKELHHIVSTAVDMARDSVMENDQIAAQEVIAMKRDINRFMEPAAMHQAYDLLTTEYTERNIIDCRSDFSREHTGYSPFCATCVICGKKYIFKKRVSREQREIRKSCLVLKCVA